MEASKRAPVPCLSVRDFGIAADAVHDNTAALQRAIDEAARRGMALCFPAGVYLCGTLHLRSHSHLHLEAGAVLQGSADAALYPVIGPTPHGNLPGQIQALLWGENVHDIRITGAGAIDGGGANALSPSEAAEVRFRPALVFLRGCRDVVFEEVALRHSCFWTLHLLRCEDVEVRGVTIAANRDRINTDGIDPDGCRNVLIEDCRIETGDDCIVLKSTEGDNCENVVVRRCLLSSSHAALKLGTESIGTIRNVVFEDCRITNSDVAIALYMKDGGLYENVRFTRIHAESYGEFPLLADITPRDYRAGSAGAIRDICLQEVTLQGPGRALFEGEPQNPISNLSLHNLRWEVTSHTSPHSNDRPPRKPLGSRRVVPNPQHSLDITEPFQIIASHIENFVVTGLHIKGLDSATPPRQEMCMSKVM